MSWELSIFLIPYVKFCIVLPNRRRKLRKHANSTVLRLISVKCMWLFSKSSCWRMKSNSDSEFHVQAPPISSDRPLAVTNWESTDETTIIKLKINIRCALGIWMVETTGCQMFRQMHHWRSPQWTPLTHGRVWLASGLSLLPPRLSPEFHQKYYIFKICITDDASLVLSLRWKLFPT